MGIIVPTPDPRFHLMVSSSDGTVDIAKYSDAGTFQGNVFVGPHHAIPLVLAILKFTPARSNHAIEQALVKVMTEIDSPTSEHGEILREAQRIHEAFCPGQGWSVLMNYEKEGFIRAAHEARRISEGRASSRGGFLR